MRTERLKNAKHLHFFFHVPPFLSLKGTENNSKCIGVTNFANP